MAVSKEVTCPHCKKGIPFSLGFEHDADLNFICSFCSKIIFAVTEADENALKKVYSPMGFHNSWTKKEALPIKINEDVVEENIQNYDCFC